jgi:hypothetical protein
MIRARNGSNFVRCVLSPRINIFSEFLEEEQSTVLVVGDTVWINLSEEDVYITKFVANILEKFGCLHLKSR